MTLGDLLSDVIICYLAFYLSLPYARKLLFTCTGIHLTHYCCRHLSLNFRRFEPGHGNPLNPLYTNKGFTVYKGFML